MTARQQGHLAAIGVTLLVVATHLPLLLGYASPIWDALEFFGPYQMLIGDYVRSGQLLLWNPFTSFGSPDGIEPQLGAFSPLVNVFGLLFGGSRHGFEAYWLFVWLVGPLGMLRLARHLGTPAWGAYSVAAGWALSGFYTGHAEHTAWIASVSPLPWILWRLDVALRDRQTWPGIEAGALWGLSALAGYPGIIFLNACFAAAWALCRSQHLFPTIKVLAAMAATGLVVLSPTYVSFAIEGRGYSHRTGALPFDVAVENNALHPLALTTLTSPGLALADAYEYTDISMRSLYVGSIVPVLAVLALVSRRSGFRWLLFMAGLLFLSAAFGHALPVRGWLYEWVLPTRYFRNAAMFRVYLMLTLAVLALFGASDIQSLLDTAARRRRMAFAVGAATSVVALGVWVVATQTVSEFAIPSLAQWLQPVAGWGALFVLCVVGAFSSVRARTVVPAAVVILASVDAVASAYVMRPIMYGAATSPWRELDARRVAKVDLTAPGLARAADNGNNFTLPLKVASASGYAPLTGPLIREYASQQVLLDAAVGTGRLWFSPAAEQVERSSACLARLGEAAVRLGSPPVVIHPAHAMDDHVLEPAGDCAAVIGRLPAAIQLDANTVHVDSYTPARLRLRVYVPEAGWLLVTDSWSRGWTAMVNGRPAEVAGGNFLFRAVRVGPGGNEIDMRYRPFGYPWLIAVSWMTLGVVLVVSWRRRRSAPPRSPPVSPQL